MASYTDFAIECSRGDALTLNIVVTQDGTPKNVSTWTGFKLLAKSSMSAPEEDARFRLTEADGIDDTDADDGLLVATISAAATRALEDKKAGRVLYVEVYGTDADGWTWTLARGTLTCWPLTWAKVYAFDPRSISSLTLWLEAYQGLYQDVAHTTPSVLNGDAVSYWKDKSGKGHHFSLVSGATPATKILSAQNNLPAVRTAGASAFVGPGLWHLIKDSGFTAFLVGKMTTTPTDTTAPWISSLTEVWNIGYDDAGSARLYKREPGSDVLVEATCPLDTYALIEARHDDDEVGLRVNGGAEATDSCSYTYFGEPNDAVQPMTLLFKDYSSRYAGADIAALLVFNEALSAGNKAKVRDQLIARYALSALRATVTRVTPAAP